jgi:hypothetical protein
MKVLTPLKAIRAKCLDCCGGSANEVKLCEIEDCPLFPYRFGKRPVRVRRGIATRPSLPEKPLLLSNKVCKNGDSTAGQ